MRVLTALVLFVGLFLADPVGLRSAQTVPARGCTISGTVLDPAGGALPGVTVELRQGERVLQGTSAGTRPGSR